jgi:hypothetical protein
MNKLSTVPSSTGAYYADTETNISRMSPNNSIAGLISSSALVVSTVVEIIAINRPLAQTA